MTNESSGHAACADSMNLQGLINRSRFGGCRGLLNHSAAARIAAAPRRGNPCGSALLYCSLPVFILPAIAGAQTYSGSGGLAIARLGHSAGSDCRLAKLCERARRAVRLSNVGRGRLLQQLPPLRDRCIPFVLFAASGECSTASCRAICAVEVVAEADCFTAASWVDEPGAIAASAAEVAAAEEDVAAAEEAPGAVELRRR